MHKPVNGKHRQDRDETLTGVIASNLFSLLKIFLICFVLVYFTVNFLIRPIHVSGRSMFPTIDHGELAFSNAFSARFQEIERGDVVIAYEDKALHRMVIKRVIGLPGDTVSCKDDTLYINHHPYHETYLDNEWANTIRETIPFTDDFEEITLGKEEYFLLGDNRVNSKDSRNFGPFDRDQIKGKHVLIVFPLNKIRIVD